jgi:hypothetical protein
MAGIIFTMMLVNPPTAPASEGHEHVQEIRLDLRSLDDAVNAVAFFHREIETHLQKNELSKVHVSAFAARDAATSMTEFAVGLPEEKRSQLKGHITRIGSLAGQLDKYGDAGQAVETAAFAAKLKQEVVALQHLTGISASMAWKPKMASPGAAHAQSKCPHKARHGGRFTMALHDAYHLEGVYASPGDFRIYFYDSESCEIPVSGVSGRVLFQDQQHQLVQDPGGQYLTVRLPGDPVPPVSLTAILDLPRPDGSGQAIEHYSYNFYKLSKAAAPKDSATTADAAAGH